MAVTEGNSYKELELSVPISGVSNGDIKDILWRQLSNFHDLSWLIENASFIKEAGGDPFSFGATRTFASGGTEKVIERDDRTRLLKYDFDKYQDFEASLKINDHNITFKLQGHVPDGTWLDYRKQVMTERLSICIAESVITDNDKVIMDQNVDFLDRYTRLILYTIPKNVLRSSTEPTTSSVVNEPTLKQQSRRQISNIQIGKYTLSVLKKDDYYGNVRLADRVLFGLLANTILFPITDKYVDFPEHLVEKFRAYHAFDKCFPPPNTYYEEIETDDAISRMAFYGIMSLWMKDDKETPGNEDGFVCDYSQIADLTPRPGFRNLGAKAYFNCTGKLLRIHDCSKKRDYTPDSPQWKQAKMLLKVSVGLWNTACDHLIGVHMVATNPVINAAVQNLPTTHPIRRLIQPFSFRSVYVNNRGIKSLLDPGSIVAHAVGYPPKEIPRLLELAYERCELWGTPEERISNAGPNIQKITNEGKFPYGSHSGKLYTCFAKFVDNVVEHIYKSDEEVENDKDLQQFASHLKNELNGAKFQPPDRYSTKNDVIKVLATFMFNATGMHEYLGSVSQYFDSPNKLGVRLREGATKLDFQCWIIGMLLFTVTTVPMPKLLEKFDECYTQEYERNEWNKCLEMLEALSVEIQKENLQCLKYPFRCFDPQYMECSVNV